MKQTGRFLQSVVLFSLPMLILNRAFEPSIRFGPLWADTVAGTALNATNVLLESSPDLQQWHPRLNFYARTNVFMFREFVQLVPAEQRRFYRASSRAQSMAQLIERWQNAGVRDYEFDYWRVSFNGNPQPWVTIEAKVTVRDGKVVKVEDANVPNPELTWFKTID